MQRPFYARKIASITALVTAMIISVPMLFVNARAEMETPGATERYRAYLIEDISHALGGARRLRERLVANDVDGAKKAWIEARIGWERAEVFTTGFVSDLDEEIDAWPNALMGFHAIEARLFGAHATDIAVQADQLIYRLTDLDIKIRQIPLNAQGLLNGTARLAYEVGESKANGGESRYSGTSLDDMRNNINGIQLAYQTLFASSLEASDPKLADSTRQTIQELATLLSGPNVGVLESDKVRMTSEKLIVALQAAAPKMGLRKPTLEDITE